MSGIEAAGDPKTPTNLKRTIHRGPIQLPLDSEIITDADEEVFLLYTNLQASPSRSGSDGDSSFRGLGHVDSRKDTLTIRFELKPPAHVAHPEIISSTQPRTKRSRIPRKARSPTIKPAVEGKTIEVELVQDKTALRSRKGDTGSVIWKASVDFARLILQQHHAHAEISLFNYTTLETSHVLELGAGTGLLSVLLSPLVKQYTVTDIDALLPLIRKNLTLNFDGWPNSNTSTSNAVHGSNVSVEALDWEKLHSMAVPLRPRYFSSSPVDLILIVDCIYHPSLLPSLVESMDFLATPGRTAILVVVELRAEDVIREFLNLWIALEGWEIWRVGGDVLGMPYVMWLGWKSL